VVVSGIKKANLWGSVHSGWLLIDELSLGDKALD